LVERRALVSGSDEFPLPTAMSAAGICQFSAARSICVGGTIIADVAEFG
jgi:hypothetical protein